MHVFWALASSMSVCRYLDCMCVVLSCMYSGHWPLAYCYCDLPLPLKLCLTWFLCVVSVCFSWVTVISCASVCVVVFDGSSQWCVCMLDGWFRSDSWAYRKVELVWLWVIHLVCMRLFTCACILPSTHWYLEIKGTQLEHARAPYRNSLAETQLECEAYSTCRFSAFVVLNRSEWFSDCPFCWIANLVVLSSEWVPEAKAKVEPLSGWYSSDEWKRATPLYQLIWSLWLIEIQPVAGDVSAPTSMKNVANCDK